jgi:uncharacterized FAD-dependent dehydrogenase
MICGMGGGCIVSGTVAFSDGKLTLSTHVGDFLEEFMPGDQLRNPLVEVNQIYLHYGAPEKIHGTSSDQNESLAYVAKQVGMEFIPV